MPLETQTFARNVNFLPIILVLKNDTAAVCLICMQNCTNSMSIEILQTFSLLCVLYMSLSLWFSDLSIPDAIPFASQNRLLARKRKFGRRRRATFLDNNLKDQVKFKYIFQRKKKGGGGGASKGCLYALQTPLNSL